MRDGIFSFKISTPIVFRGTWPVVMPVAGATPLVFPAFPDFWCDNRSAADDHRVHPPLALFTDHNTFTAHSWHNTLPIAFLHQSPTTLPHNSHTLP